MNTPRITMPTKSLMQGCTYRPAIRTDVRHTFLLYLARQLLEKAK